MPMQAHILAHWIDLFMSWFLKLPVLLRFHYVVFFQGSNGVASGKIAPQAMYILHQWHLK